MNLWLAPRAVHRELARGTMPLPPGVTGHLPSLALEEHQEPWSVATRS